MEPVLRHVVNRRFSGYRWGVPSSPRRARSRSRSAVGLLVLAFGVAACSGGPGNEEDLVTALTQNDAFNTAEAECIAAAVFEEYGDDEDTLTKISGAVDYEDLSGTEGVDGFDKFFTRAVGVCTNS